MSVWEKTIIPLDDAHEVLSVFGIGPYSRAYQRWRTERGFRQVDFQDVLGESSLVLGVDWRGWLQESVDEIIRQLGELGIEASADLGEDGNQGVIQVMGQRARIKYVLADEDDFDRVVASINQLIGQVGHYRKFRSCEGTDGRLYALLKNGDWQALDSAASTTMELIFTNV